jgi:hypothetical protein
MYSIKGGEVFIRRLLDNQSECGVWTRVGQKVAMGIARKEKREMLFKGEFKYFGVHSRPFSK